MTLVSLSFLVPTQATDAESMLTDSLASALEALGDRDHKAPWFVEEQYVEHGRQRALVAGTFATQKTQEGVKTVLLTVTIRAEEDVANPFMHGNQQATSTFAKTLTDLGAPEDAVKSLAVVKGKLTAEHEEKEVQQGNRRTRTSKATTDEDVPSPFQARWQRGWYTIAVDATAGFSGDRLIWSPRATLGLEPLHALVAKVLTARGSRVAKGGLSVSLARAY
jgi:hypothetical protein